MIFTVITPLCNHSYTNVRLDFFSIFADTTIWRVNKKCITPPEIFTADFVWKTRATARPAREWKWRSIYLARTRPRNHKSSRDQRPRDATYSDAYHLPKFWRLVSSDDTFSDDTTQLSACVIRMRLAHRGSCRDDNYASTQLAATISENTGVTRQLISRA